MRSGNRRLRPVRSDGATVGTPVAPAGEVGSPGAPEADLHTDEGLRALYHAHGAELYRFALRQLGDAGAAADVVQEVFLRAWRAADRYDPTVASVRVWLFAIARNVVVDEARKSASRPVRPESDDRLAHATPNAQDFAEGAVTEWLVEEALQRIGPQHRAVLVESYLRGRSHAEIAAELQVPVGTVRSRVFYGLKALRLALDEMGVAT